MADYTDDYGLIRLGPGDDLSTDNWKFGTTDRDFIAQALRHATEGHKHDGLTAAGGGFDVGLLELGLTQGQDDGVIPGGMRVYYTFTIVVDGVESDPADVSYVDTPDPIDSPSAPTLVTATTGGTLLPGGYYYALTAYVGTNTQETQGTASRYISVPQSTNTNTITLTLPELPDGADGFNVYRKQPGGVRYDFVASVDMQVATPPTEFEDDGTIEEDCNRTLPQQNQTNIQNHVLVELVGTPDPGTTWRLYRSYVEGTFVSTRIYESADTFEFDDLGAAATSYTPPTEGVELGNPQPVDLTDSAEVQGTLPPGMVSAFPLEKSFFFPGTLVAGESESSWACPFEEAYVIGAIATLGRGSSPASLPVVVDVQIVSGATPTFRSVYADVIDMPTIIAGDEAGSFADANVDAEDRHLYQGDLLSTEILQTGGGATPTDEDLTIGVLLEVKYGSALVSTVWLGA